VDSEIRLVDNRGRLRAEAPDPVPRLLRMPTDRAARRIVRAVARGRSELIITLHGRIAVFLARHTPRLLASVVRRSRLSRRQPC
jgi:hypothetical protein